MTCFYNTKKDDRTKEGNITKMDKMRNLIKSTSTQQFQFKILFIFKPLLYNYGDFIDMFAVRIGINIHMVGIDLYVCRFFERVQGSRASCVWLPACEFRGELGEQVVGVGTAAGLRG